MCSQQQVSTALNHTLDLNCFYSDYYFISDAIATAAAAEAKDATLVTVIKQCAPLIDEISTLLSMKVPFAAGTQLQQIDDSVC